jgi:polyisoprenoid-binding protein YceI
VGFEVKHMMFATVRGRFTDVEGTLSIGSEDEESTASVGDLSIRDVVRRVDLDVEESGRGTDPWGNERVGFTATAKIDRRDYGLTWNQALETGGILVGNEVRIVIEAQAVRPES